MPFRMRISKIAGSATEITVFGELVEGSYSGPEFVMLCDTGGRWTSSSITSHQVQFPKNWPITPGDGSTLVLHIRRPDPAFDLDPDQTVVGQGVIARNDRRVDITHLLADPAFWALQLSSSLESDSLPDPTVAWGFTGGEIDESYSRFLQRHWDVGVWPFVRLPVDDSRYVEIEYCVAIEHQDRIWIGAGDSRRVLLGYDSGHFSFPSFRIAEVLLLADRMNIHPSAPLLLLRGAYLSIGDTRPIDDVRTWLKHVPGIRPEYIPAILEQLLANVVPGLEWHEDPTLGWINNWTYSQRNPQSGMSILEERDFPFIKWFFDVA